MSVRQVWVRQAELAAGPPRALAAHRVWADALLDRAGADTSPPVVVRAGALLGQLEQADGFQAVEVDRSRCATSVPSSNLPLFQGWAWSGALLDHLSDLYAMQGLEVFEHLLPCTVGNLMRLTSTEEVLRGTRQDLLRDVQEYFGPDIHAYLAGWGPLDGRGTGVHDVEVVVPWSALRSAERVSGG